MCVAKIACGFLGPFTVHQDKQQCVFAEINFIMRPGCVTKGSALSSLGCHEVEIKNQFIQVVACAISRRTRTSTSLPSHTGLPTIYARTCENPPTLAADDDVNKRQFHCDACGICRVGGRENYFHCECFYPLFLPWCKCFWLADLIHACNDLSNWIWVSAYFAVPHA